MSETMHNPADATARGVDRLRVRPMGAALGAEVQGIDVRALDDELFTAIHRAWLDHQVLLFRDQTLTDEELVNFSRRFGELDEAPVQETGQRFVEGHPEIYVVSNVVQDGVAIGSLGAGEAVWHTDMSYLPNPPKASVLYALEVPASGGDTSFCSMYAAWDAMPGVLRRRVEGARVKHDGTYNSGGYVRQGVTPTDDPRTSKDCRSRSRTRCWMRSGPWPPTSRSRGGIRGASAISCSGTTGARCTAVMRSTPPPGASCTGHRSEASPLRFYIHHTLGPNI